MSRIDPASLAGSWLLSEKRAEHVVYRPESFFTAPGRPRRGFELRADGTMTHIDPGAADQGQFIPGRWEIGDDGDLLVYTADSETPFRLGRVASATAHELVLAKTPPS